MKTLTVLAALLLPIGSIAANKCTVDGKTVYQDTPCASGGAKVDTRANGAIAEDEEPAPERGRAYRREGGERQERRKVDHQAVTLGMATGKPVVGMTQNQLNIAMGSPNRRNTGDYGSTQSDQLIYERQGITYYVYVRDGVVSSVQSSEGYRTSVGSSKRCPTSIEIRNMQTTANSDSINESQRRELLREIRSAKNCN